MTTSPAQLRAAVPAGDPFVGLLDRMADAAGAAPGGVGCGRLVDLVHEPARPARHGPLARPLPTAVAERLPEALWTHQAAAVDHARAGRSVVVASGTSSGKSLCFQAPIGEAVVAPVRPGTALLVFPTKALAHDQLRALTDLGLPGVVAGAYDGDAGTEERAWIRRHANVVLTNPEMLHCALLPHHERWATFLGRLRYVVVDELHAFRGIFGSHVAHVLRRLRRLAAHHGADPTFISCSATVGDAGRLATELTGVPTVAVDDDGSPRAPRTWMVWEPPVVEPATGRRGSAHAETAAVAGALIRDGHVTLGFTRSRRSAEVVAADIRRRLPSGLARRVRAYRGGYLADERRDIEDALSAGRLRGVVATTALELGIDVGHIDAVVVDGFPGTVSSFRQQAGRAGRRGDAAVAVLVAGADQLDQWFVRHPRDLHARPPEQVVINPANPEVLVPHLRCAAHERALTPADERWWPRLLDEGVRRLVLDDELVVRRRGRRREPVAVWAGTGWPAHGVGLRTAGGAPVRILGPGDDLIGDVDRSRACAQVHPGASYLHQGRHWTVTELDLDEGVARVEVHDGATYTVPRRDTRVALGAPERTRAHGGGPVALGPVEVRDQVVGYQRKDALTGRVVDRRSLELPATSLATRATWWSVAPALLAGLDRDRIPGALHAAEHAAISVLPLFAICDRWDVGGLSTARHPDVGGPVIVIHDAVPGGSGIAELVFDRAGEVLAAALEVVASCPCADGCPSCVQSPKCGNANEHLDKAAARRLLEGLAGA